MHSLIVYNHLQYSKNKQSNKDNDKEFMGNQKKLHLETIKIEKPKG